MYQRIFSIVILLLALSYTSPAIATAMSPSVVVEAAKAEEAIFQPEIHSVGTLVAEQGTTIKPEISGRVIKIFFNSGDYVQQSAPLVQIYPDILQAELEANQAAVELSKANFKRSKDLYRKGAISSSQFDTASSQLKSDKANLEKTKAALTQTLISAPFNGRLGIRQISIGDYLAAGTAIVNLEDVNPIYVDFTVPERYLQQVKAGNRVNIKSNAYGDQVFSGKVTAVDSRIDVNTRTLNVRAAIPNANHILVPGSFVEVYLLLGAPQKLISIPQTALSYSEQGDYVYRVVNGKALKTSVTLGQRTNNNIYIADGLKVGDIIITAGSLKLHDGVAVTIRSDHSSD